MATTPTPTSSSSPSSSRRTRRWCRWPSCPRAFARRSGRSTTPRPGGRQPAALPGPHPPGHARARGAAGRVPAAQPDRRRRAALQPGRDATRSRRSRTPSTRSRSSSTCRVLVPADSPSAAVSSPRSAPGRSGRLRGRAPRERARGHRGVPGAGPGGTRGRAEDRAAGCAGGGRERRGGGGARTRHLGGRSSPALVEHGSHRGRPFLAQWRPGVPVTVAAQRARAARTRGAPARAVPRRAVAYAWLHGRDVVHGDIHPGNVIVGDGGAVTTWTSGDRASSPRRPTRCVPAWRTSTSPRWPGRSRREACLHPRPRSASSTRSPRSCTTSSRASTTRPSRRSRTCSSPRSWSGRRCRSPRAASSRGPPSRRCWPPRSPRTRPSASRASPISSARSSAQALTGPPRGLRIEPAGAAGRLLASSVAGRSQRRHDRPAAARDLAWFAHRAAQARDDPDLLARADVWACRASTGLGARGRQGRDPPRSWRRRRAGSCGGLDPRRMRARRGRARPPRGAQRVAVRRGAGAGRDGGRRGRPRAADAMGP